MGVERRTFTFGAGDSEGIVAEMRAMAAAATDSTWMNIVPDVAEHEIHTGSIFWRVLSSRGPVVPTFTWVPAHDVKGRRVHCQVGILHATGRDAVGRLADSRVALPEGWVLEQDHTKRGVIVAVPPTADEATIVDFAVRALPVLSPFAFEPYYEATFSWGRGSAQNR